MVLFDCSLVDSIAARSKYFGQAGAFFFFLKKAACIGRWRLELWIHRGFGIERLGSISGSRLNTASLRGSSVRMDISDVSRKSGRGPLLRGRLPKSTGLGIRLLALSRAVCVCVNFVQRLYDHTRERFQANHAIIISLEDRRASVSFFQKYSPRNHVEIAIPDKKEHVLYRKPTNGKTSS